MTAIMIGDIGGVCPVQATGTFDGRPFYFRARWSLTISMADNAGDDPVSVSTGRISGWYWNGTGNPEFDGNGHTYEDGKHHYGWMELDAARKCIETVLEAFSVGDLTGWTRVEGRQGGSLK